MSLFDKIFGRAPKPVGKYEGSFVSLTGHRPHFTRWGGDVYEREIIRAIINAIAVHVSKLKVEVQGAARPALQNKLKHGPNQWQTWSQFLYRLETIRQIHNTAFIVPVYDQFGEPSGIFTPLPDRCEIIEYGDTPYLRYKFSHGETAAIELAYCGIMTKFQYRDDFFGENNHALIPTLELIHIQNQGIQEGVKSAATYRFMAKVNNFSKAEDLKKERKRFTEENLREDGGGMLLFPNTYTDIKQVDSKPWVIEADQMKIIKENAFDYFGVNEDFLQNKAYGDAWAAVYEGIVETFAIQFSEVCTKMLFTFREQSQGNRVMATSNRLQYMSNADKLKVSAQMMDRGIMSINEVREIWNMPPVENGDVRLVRGEYYGADEKITSITEGEEDGEDGE